MRCVKCGREGEAAEFCSKCGASQSRPAARGAPDRGNVVVERRRGNGFGLPPMDPVRWILLALILGFGACSVAVCSHSL